MEEFTTTSLSDSARDSCSCGTGSSRPRGSTFTYSYQGLNILYEKNVTGSTTTTTKHFYAGGLQLAKMANSTEYYHQDALGSTRLVMPASMVPSFSSDYVPYGMSYAMVGEEAFQCTGKLLDEAAGLLRRGRQPGGAGRGRGIAPNQPILGGKTFRLRCNTFYAFGVRQPDIH